MANYIDIDYNNFVNTFGLENMCSVLNDYQLSENLLIATLPYYESKWCLKTQKFLSPFFCFAYLYDNDTDSYNETTDYNDIINYFHNRYSLDELEDWYNKAMDFRNNNL
jgi:hypothetical protein